MLKLAIIKEGKTPPDSRVPLTPNQCRIIQQNYPIEITVQSAAHRCYTDQEYQQAGIAVCDELNDADIFMGVKEVPIDQLIPHKKYFFFSHTIKEQAYNRKLLQAILQKDITLYDYEVLKNQKGERVIAFGVFAGMVGAHNGLMAYGRRTQELDIPRMYSFHDYMEAKAYYKSIKIPNIKIVLTGTGRVGQGAHLVLSDMNIRQVSTEDFLAKDYAYAVFCQLDPAHYVAPKGGGPYIKSDFYEHPEDFKSIFGPYTEVADIMINGIYWDNEAPAFFSLEDMKQDSFRLKVIADVTCDIAPISSIPSTIKASTIAQPIFGFDPFTGKEVPAHSGEHIIDMMTIDNLPNELPRDASEAFGAQFIDHVLPELFKNDSQMLLKATVAEHGHLGKCFEYLTDFVSKDS